MKAHTRESCAEAVRDVAVRRIDAVSGRSPLEMGGCDQQFLRATKRPELVGHDPIRLVDLFSGCGGFSVGVEAAAATLKRGLEVLLAIERDAEIAALYSQNFETALGQGLPGDVLDSFGGCNGLRLEEFALRRQLPDVDLLVGGPPCQGHSSLNNHTRGDDPKNDLYLVMARAATVLRPTHVIIENVPGATRDALGIVDRCREKFLKQGYQVDAGVVCVADIGVPQLRRRHVLLASRTAQPDLEIAIKQSRIDAKRTVRWAIEDLADLAENTTALFDTASKLSPQNVRRARWLISKGKFDLPNERRPKCQRSDHKYKSMYGRLQWGEPAQTITTGFGSPGQGRYLHPEKLRTLTPHEAARLQSFPDWFDFSGASFRRVLSDAIGNAVPPKLAFVLSHHLLTLPSGTQRSDAPTCGHG